MGKTYMIAYLDSNGEITHFDYRGFTSYLKASVALLDAELEPYPQYDPHSSKEDESETCDLLFEFNYGEGDEAIHWMASIHELENV